MISKTGLLVSLVIVLLSVAATTTNIPIYNIANAVKHHSHAITHTTNANKSSITPINTTSAPPGNANTLSPPVVHNTRARAAAGGPTLNDPNLKLERIIDTGLKSTTSMAFLGPDDILVLEKDTGIVHRILNGKIVPEPLLDVSVANEAERGLL